MQLPEVLAILAALRQEACDVWVGGSWGVDALVGRQTRAHRDLDLALNAAHEMRAMKLLEQRGYRIETDWRPVRVELVAPELGWVDVHPVVFDATGHGRQADLDGGHFAYPPETFVYGAPDGVPVPCLWKEQQLRFHSSYPPRQADLHDLKLLEELPDRPQLPRQ
jgi:lincosamide nucleotidyltransferase A/C/D/E